MRKTIAFRTFTQQLFGKKVAEFNKSITHKFNISHTDLGIFCL